MQVLSATANSAPVPGSAVSVHAPQYTLLTAREPAAD